MLKCLMISLAVFLPHTIYAGTESNSAKILLEAAVERSNIYLARDIKDFSLSLEINESINNKALESTEMKVKVLKNESDIKALIRFTSPKAINGMTYLVFLSETKKVPEEIWIYLPSFDKTKRISAIKAKKTLPESSFRFLALNAEKFDYDDFSFEWHEEEVDSAKEDLVIKVKEKKGNENETKLVWVNKTENLINKILIMNDKDELIEEHHFLSYMDYGSFSLPSEIREKNNSSKKTSSILIEDVKINQGFNEIDFNIESIKNPF